MKKDIKNSREFSVNAHCSILGFGVNYVILINRKTRCKLRYVYKKHVIIININIRQKIK